MKNMKSNAGSFATAKLQAKRRSLLAILAITLVFGMTVVGCDDGSTDNNSNENGGGANSTFTLNGIPAIHNGKYALLSASGVGSDSVIIGCQSLNLSQGTMVLSPISNGRVSIPLWTLNTSTTNTVQYSGNDTASSVVIGISNDQTLSSTTGTITFYNVAFLNGSATRSWSAGQYSATTAPAP